MSNSKIILALLGAAAAGITIAYLFNTEKGEEIRNDLKEKAKGLADTILAKAEEILDEAESSASQSR